MQGDRALEFGFDTPHTSGHIRVRQREAGSRRVWSTHNTPQLRLPNAYQPKSCASHLRPSGSASCFACAPRLTTLAQLNVSCPELLCTSSLDDAPHSTLPKSSSTSIYDTIWYDGQTVTSHKPRHTHASVRVGQLWLRLFVLTPLWAWPLCLLARWPLRAARAKLDAWQAS